MDLSTMRPAFEELRKKCLSGTQTSQTIANLNRVGPFVLVSLSSVIYSGHKSKDSILRVVFDLAEVGLANALGSMSDEEFNELLKPLKDATPDDLLLLREATR